VLGEIEDWGWGCWEIGRSWGGMVVGGVGRGVRGDGRLGVVGVGGLGGVWGMVVVDLGGVGAVSFFGAGEGGGAAL